MPCNTDCTCDANPATCVEHATENGDRCRCDICSEDLVETADYTIGDR